METPSDSTLYPKITNHIRDIIKTLHHKQRDPEHPEREVTLAPVPIIGTVKLHGTHADILFHNDTITLQSRNTTNLLTTADNHGFATAMAPLTQPLLRLRDRFIARWKALNPTAMLDPTQPLTLAGEWIGSNIQKGVALVHLSKRLIIISAKINGVWVPDSAYADIEAPEHAIYNISRGGVFHATLYPADPQRTIAELEPPAEKVAARCPFAASFGVEGEGEGIVWKIVPYVDEPRLWFKTKGGRFKPTFAPAPKKLAEGEAEKREAAEAVARVWCSEGRLEQGWDYLRETGLERNMRGIGPFLKWVQRDVLVEERGYIQEHGIDEEALKREITAVAKSWYLEKSVAEG